MGGKVVEAEEEMVRGREGEGEEELLETAVRARRGFFFVSRSKGDRGLRMRVETPELKAKREFVEMEAVEKDEGELERNEL